MGGGYQIDLGAMNTLVGTLNTAARAITDANAALRAATVAELGHDELNAAAGDFKNRWVYGTGKISDLTGKMTGALRATVQSYQDVENQLAQAFQATGDGKA